MARYEGMDEILKGVSKRLMGQPAPPVGEITFPHLSQVPAPDRPYARIEEALTHLYAEAEHFRDMLNAEAVQTLTQEEHEQLLTMLGSALQELWNCEVALQRVAPYD